MLRTAIILGSTRPGRRGALLAPWVLDIARDHPSLDGETVVVDLAEAGLPLLDEPAPAMFGSYRHEHTQRWADLIREFDAFVFVTPEYNHSVPAALKNALDHLFHEWTDKAAGIVSYGTNGGSRAAEHLRQILGELQVATVRTQPALSLFDDFVITDPLSVGEFAPRPNQRALVEQMLSEVASWSGALRPLRTAVRPAA